MWSFGIIIYYFRRSTIKIDMIIKPKDYLILIALCCMSILLLSCRSKEKQREKELRILYSREFVDEQYGQEMYLSDFYRHHAADFFATKNDTVPLAKWDTLLDEMAKLKRYKPEMNDILHKHNYCSNLEIEFFDHEQSLCQLCLNPDNKTLRLNYLVYEASPELISFFGNYISLDSAVLAASGKSNYVKKVMFNDRRGK
ncbi:hypothetical protein DCO56_20560 [Sphingobacterium athyrii]|uniref:Uncharacterized protein n=2 Tax=Sphingobacterium athyrii TaxID=2152717 RepID=A0A363NPE8_9SPHI|nr:hypothetical protein DCO56_20560 [Sphingobacterium athyrii]